MGSSNRKSYWINAQAIAELKKQEKKAQAVKKQQEPITYFDYTEEIEVPEGPEVKISTDWLNENFKGKQLAAIDYPKTGRYGGEKLPVGFDLIKGINMTVKGVQCRGKFQYWDLDNGLYMFCTYGMSGQWNKQSSKYTVAELKFSDGTSAFFNDIRRFGTLKFIRVIDGQKNMLEAKLKTLGPDILSSGKPLCFEHFKFCLKKKKGWNLSKILMDQSVISGIGNYLKAEILYDCKLSPNRTYDSLSDDDIKRLYDSSLTISLQAYLSKGSTIKTHKNPDGVKGSFSDFFKVYGKKHDPLGNPVRSEKIKGETRVTHWVPEVQV